MEKKVETNEELKDLEIVEEAIEELENSEYLAWDKACRVSQTTSS